MSGRASRTGFASFFDSTVSLTQAFEIFWPRAGHVLGDGRREARHADQAARVPRQARSTAPESDTGQPLSAVVLLTFLLEQLSLSILHWRPSEDPPEQGGDGRFFLLFGELVHSQTLKPMLKV